MSKNVINPVLMSEVTLINAIVELYYKSKGLSQVKYKKYIQKQEKKIARTVPTLNDFKSFSGQIDFLSETLNTINDKLQVQTTLSNDRETVVICAVTRKQIEICLNIQQLLDHHMIYGAYSLWRNLYEMDIVFWGLFFPLFANKDLDKTDLLTERYTDYMSIENAVVKQIGLNLKDFQYNHLSKDRQLIYNQAQKIIHKYNFEDYNKQKENSFKLVKSYDWSLPLFNQSEKKHMLPINTPNFYDLVKKARVSTMLYSQLYSEYVKSSGYIHSSFLSTKFTNNDQAINHIRYNSQIVLHDYINMLLKIPNATMGYLLNNHIIDDSEKIQQQKFLFKEYQRIINKKMTCNLQS